MPSILMEPAILKGFVVHVIFYSFFNLLTFTKVNSVYKSIFNLFLECSIWYTFLIISMVNNSTYYLILFYCILCILYCIAYAIISYQYNSCVYMCLGVRFYSCKWRKIFRLYKSYTITSLRLHIVIVCLHKWVIVNVIAICNMFVTNDF